MNLKETTVLEVRGIRVLTTKQLAAAYETTPDIIKWNFRYNRKRYIEGKHFLELKGDELREEKRRVEILPLLKQAKCVHLWTEKGALFHAKSINTDKAWEVYDYLVDFYFRAKSMAPEPIVPKPAGKEVVDVPENMEIQAAISEVKKHLVAVEVGLEQYNVYRSVEGFQQNKEVLADLALKLFLKTKSMLEMKPRIVRKGY